MFLFPCPGKIRNKRERGKDKSGVSRFPVSRDLREVLVGGKVVYDMRMPMGVPENYFFFS